MLPSSKVYRITRVTHRYLGFFLAGIMSVYAISGIALIFRDTDFLKKEKHIKRHFKPNISKSELGQILKIKKIRIEKEENGLYYFKEGTYNKNTGLAEYTVKKLPIVLNKMTHLHKAKSSDPLYFLNIFFGISLLIFVISAFWMFSPKTKIFQKGLYFTIAGMLLTLILLFV